MAIGTLYRHFETRGALVAEVYRQDVAELCAAPARLLADHAPDEALRTFLLLIVEHAAVGKGMGEALESVLATESPVFDDARNEMARALDELLAAGAAAGLVRGDVDGRIVLRALGGICGLRAAGWKDDAVRIAAILYDGLRYGAPSPRDS
ncbi:hypothetical protein GCM10009741_76140 [Kribbella lupini]|uniref:Transcriptional regulator SbtR-like C-terminal domain-containing protein n=1 Tax=Kribbella lupini TaxID=291602 RepID=A0ABN2CJR3_9ACTN